MQRQANTFLTLHTAPFTLHTCTSHYTLHLISDHVSSPHLISPHLSSSHLISPHLSSSHLIPSLLTCHLGKFFSAAFTSSEHWSTYLLEVLLNSSQLFCATDRSLLHKKPLGAKSFCVQKLGTQMHLHRKAFTKYFVLQSLHKHFPVLLCTRKLAQSTPQYYFVPQSLHRILPSTKLAQSTPQYYFLSNYKACTE